MSTPRVALVTGSTSGIGLATAERFRAEGWRVVLNSARSAAAGEALAAAHEGYVYVQADVSADGGAEALVDEATAAWGRLDALVNNAGTTRVIAHHDLAAATPEVWRELYDVNVVSPWRTCVRAMPELAARGGSIVNVGSIAGLRPTGSSIPYAASKAALHHLTVLLAKVAGPEVRVNAVAPGLVDTPWTSDWDVVRQFVSATAPLKRSGRPEDVAEVIWSLTNSSYVTGQVLAVDGGFTLAV